MLDSDTIRTKIEALQQKRLSLLEEARPFVQRLEEIEQAVAVLQVQIDTLCELERELG